MNTEVGSSVARAVLEDGVPTPTGEKGRVGYRFTVEPGTSLEWYSRFREQLAHLDDRIRLPLWPYAQRPATAIVIAPANLPAEEFVAVFEFAAMRADGL